MTPKTKAVSIAAVKNVFYISATKTLKFFAEGDKSKLSPQAIYDLRVEKRLAEGVIGLSGVATYVIQASGSYRMGPEVLEADEYIENVPPGNYTFIDDSTGKELLKFDAR